MRRPLIAAAAVVMMAASTLPTIVLAQGRGGDKEQDDPDAKKKKEAEWGDNQAPLPALRNAGPCPFAKALYDAARYVELNGGQEASSAVGFTGEIQGVNATCAYKADEPIRLTMNILF